MISSRHSAQIGQGDEIMFQKLLPLGLARVLALCVVCLVPYEVLLTSPSHCFADYGPSQDYGAQDPGTDMPIPDLFGQEPDGNGLAPRRARARVLRKRGRTAEKGAPKKTDTATKKKEASGTGADAGTGAPLKFSQDIAPILVANCTGCHSGSGRGLRQGKLDLSTFEKLQKGTLAHKVISAGRPDESSLVARIKEEDDRRRMPLGRNRPLTDEAIARIELWVKQGAKLDAAVARDATLESFAASPEQVRRSQLTKLPVPDRIKKVEEVGRQRWKQANAQGKPEIISKDHFVIVSSLPRERAESLFKPMEIQFSRLKRLLGSPSMDWVEPVSLIVFTNRKEFTEFVRSVERRDPDADEAAIANLVMPQPFVAAVDPLGGKKEDPAARRRGRPKKGEDTESQSGDRTLLGLLTEALGSGAVSAAGTPPRWLVKGIGSYLASQVEPRSSLYRHLRESAHANYQQGWETKATEALGGDEKLPAGDLHAIGFAFVEAMLSTELRAGFPAFVGGMLGGQGKLDDAIAKVYGKENTRADFITDVGDWVAARYGNNQ
jgi:hypothetical protein